MYASSAERPKLKVRRLRDLFVLRKQKDDGIVVARDRQRRRRGRDEEHGGDEESSEAGGDDAGARDQSAWKARTVRPWRVADPSGKIRWVPQVPKIDPAAVAT